MGKAQQTKQLIIEKSALLFNKKELQEQASATFSKSQSSPKEVCTFILKIKKPFPMPL
ncbi:hypothetical protein [Chryseobacterium wanjuense]